jgi:hypothetical protein
MPGLTLKKLRLYELFAKFAIGMLINMETLEYFLEEERKYVASHNGMDSIGIGVDEETGEILLDLDEDPLSFLMKRPFEKYSKASTFYIDETSKYNLSPVERTILSMFFSDCSAEFRDDLYYGDIPELVKKMMEILNVVVGKAPISKHDKLFRFCNDADNVNIATGDILNVKHNLTCTAENWNQNDVNVYVIQTLPTNKTRAHDLYKIYNKANEYQVDFLRNTSFKVTRIEQNGNSDGKLYYLLELPN